MSRAFVKEPDGADAFDELPEKLISEHPNLVTAAGLVFIEAEVARLTRAYAQAQAAGERSLLNQAARDLRYWSARRASAEVMPAPQDTGEVSFGSRVTIKRQDGRTSSFRIVGEDEADPAKGTLSWVSPLARALMGHGVGDVVNLSGSDVEIMGIDERRQGP